MAKSGHSLAAFLSAMLCVTAVRAQGPSLNPPTPVGVSTSSGYATPPIVQLPAGPDPVPVAAPVYNPLPITSLPAPATSAPANPAGPLPQVPTPPAAQPLPTPTYSAHAPHGTPTAAPYSGGATYNSSAPTSYALPTYPQTGTAPQLSSAPSPELPTYQPGTYSAHGNPGMPRGNLLAGEITPFANPQSPPSQSTWLPTKVASLLPHSWTGSAPAAPPPAAAYGSYPQAGCGPAPCNQQGCGPCGVCNPCGNWYDNFFLISSYDAFKGPLDLDGLNGNYGSRVGGMAAFPILRDWGLGGEIGSTAGWYDWKGTQYTGDQERFQNFITAGIFQRSCTTGLGWGIVHDWLYDNYYSDFQLSQFRVAGSWQFNCNNEIGVWAALPQRRDEAFVGTPAVQNRFQTVLQGNIYWRHLWSDYASSTLFAGLAESPSDIPWGCNVQVAVNRFVAVTGAAEYILPGSGGTQGHQEEIWNLSFGVAIYPGTAYQATRSQFRPFLPMADNGNFAVWRH